MKRSSALDAVRGIAIAQVFAWHFLAAIIAAHSAVLHRVVSLTWTGVDLFFVLSGFLIGGILMRNRDAPNYFQVFYARRFLRILPLYFLFLVVIAIVEPGTVGLEHILLVQNFVWTTHDFASAGDLTPTWSLAVEEQFYLVLPLLIRLVRPARVPSLCIALIACAPLFRLACILAGYPLGGFLLLPGRMDALFFGVLLAWVHQNGLTDRATRIARIVIVPASLSFGGLALSGQLFLDPFMQIVGYTVVGGFYACVIALVSVVKSDLRWYWRPVVWAGLGAFAIYLFHDMIGHKGYVLIGPHPIIWLSATLATIALVAVLSWNFVEAPLIRYSHRRFRYAEAEISERHQDRIVEPAG